MPSGWLSGCGSKFDSEPSAVTRQAHSAPAVRDIKVSFATELILGSASPRKPILTTCSKSCRVNILLVACLDKARGKSSLTMPQPLSLILINLAPPCSISILICVAPASKQFSINSLTTEEGLSTTSPAAIWLINCIGND